MKMDAELDLTLLPNAIDPKQNASGFWDIFATTEVETTGHQPRVIIAPRSTRDIHTGPGLSAYSLDAVLLYERGEGVGQDMIEAYAEKWGTTPDYAEGMMQHVELSAITDACTNLDA